MQGKGTPPTSKKIQVSPKYPAPNTHSPSKRMLPKSTPPPINYSPRKTLTQAIKTNNSETLLNLKPRGNLQISHNQGDTSCKIFKCNIFT